jgi:CRISPR-associated endonuclease/helicase Cas3
VSRCSPWCAAHRSAVLGEVRRRLEYGEPCRVVSTQLVEAGVDVDFPVVYRALAGIDSIVQAAGRCNREGRLEMGKVVVFRAPTSPPAGTLRRGAAVAESMLRESGGRLDPDSPARVEQYFRALYFLEDTDARQVQALRQAFSFASVAREFRLIEDGFTRDIIVPYGDGQARLARLRRDGPTREALRSLQPFSVRAHPQTFDALARAGALDELTDGVFALSEPFGRCYDATFGLVTGDEPRADPAALIT